MKLFGGVDAGVEVASLPSRERELKRPDLLTAMPTPTSLPSRERELKLDLVVVIKTEGESLPSRERELKLLRRCIS